MEDCMGPMIYFLWSQGVAPSYKVQRSLTGLHQYQDQDGENFEFVVDRNLRRLQFGQNID